MRKECFGKFMSQSTILCEKSCDKAEQKQCLAEMNKLEKHKEKQKETLNLPWYEREKQLEEKKK